MNKIKSAFKTLGTYLWDFFKGSIPAGLLYIFAGSALVMLTMKDDNLAWDSSKLTWVIVCALVAYAYNALVSYAQGGQAYEMLVSGNMKRVSAERFGDEYKISSHKEVKEFRYWKGFAIGGMIALWTVITTLVFGFNQTAIDNTATSKGLAVFVLITFFTSGWAILPIYYLNASGAGISYFLALIFALLQIIVSGAMYIAGAYGKRSKTLREQLIADKAAAAEAQKVKKVNYGGLPGTKPKKRK